MLPSILPGLKERASNRALKLLILANRAEFKLIRTRLVQNLMMDVFYADFPHVPSRPTKERREIGLYDVKILTDLTGDKSRVSLVVRQEGAFLGTLITDTREDWVSVILPQHGNLRDEMQTLVEALLLIDLSDHTMRTRAA